jgi:Concanavalin A-like lectin/glucanases superfamily
MLNNYLCFCFMKRILLIVLVISSLTVSAQINRNKVLAAAGPKKENSGTKQSRPSFSFIDRSNFTAGACSGIIDLHGNDCVRLPLSQDYYFATGFTWETWFNSSWFENNDNSMRFGQSLLLTEDPVLCEDIQVGFGWQNIPRNAIGFVVDGPGECGSRDNNPCFYRPPGGFLPNTWYHVAAVRNYLTNQTFLYLNGQLVDSKTNTLPPFNLSCGHISHNFPSL